MNEQYTGEDQEKERKHINSDSLDISAIDYFIKPYSKFDFICDVGSGLGHYLNHLKNKMGAENCKTIGYDISPICCRSAKQNFPDIDFIVKNFKVKNDNFIDSSGFKNKLFSLRESLKYMITELDNVIYNFNNLLSSGDIFIISNNLPTTNTLSLDEYEVEQSYVVNDVDHFILKMGKHFTLLRSIIKKEFNLTIRSQGLFVGLFVKK